MSTLGYFLTITIKTANEHGIIKATIFPETILSSARNLEYSSTEFVCFSIELTVLKLSVIKVVEIPIISKTTNNSINVKPFCFII